MRQRVWSLVGYQPTAAQRRVHQGLNHLGVECRKKLITGGIQSGKSYLVAAEILSYLPWLAGKEIFVIGPDFRQSRKELEYLKDWCLQLGLFDARQASMPRSDAPWSFTLKTGTLIRTFSAVNAQKIAGSTPGLVAMVEAGQQDVSSFHTAHARAGLQGVPFILSGTLETAIGWYPKLAETWAYGRAADAVAYEMPTWTNTHKFPGGRTDPLIKAFENDPATTRDTFLMRYAGKRVSPPGLVFGRTPYHPGFDPTLHTCAIALGDPPEDATPTDVWLPKDSVVELAVDPGYDHKYAVLACVIHGDPPTVYVLDEIWERGAQDHTIIRIAQSRPWWPNVSRVVLDVAARQHTPTSPLTTADTWRTAPPVGAGLPVWAEERVNPGLAADKIRKLLEIHPKTGRPRLLLDYKTTGLQWEMAEGYRNLTNAAGDVVGNPRPINDDAVKALGYGVHFWFPGLVDRGSRPRRSARRPLPFA